ncbi:uncharacterized protein LOC135367180 [Ornithodoros turicata]|uniref:uncharacterized protein LOC135367180 n=1 Tax=Ornithodoros turicata TaxID=34597 RepID=UPI003139ED94
MGNDPEASACLPPYIQQLATAISSSDGYAVISIAAATLAVGLNLIQAVVVMLFACTWKSAYYIALCFCGLLSAVALVWHVVAIRLPHTEGCGAVPSALSIAVLVGYTAHMTAPIIHHCIADTWPRAFASHSRNRGICVLLNGFAWCETALLAAAVLSDWPSVPPTPRATSLGGNILTQRESAWEDACALPRFWSSTFSVFVSVLYFLHVLLDLVILADMTLADGKQRQYSECDSVYEYRVRGDLRQLWTKFFLLILGTSPFVATMLYQAAGPFGAHCTLFKELLPVWTLISSVMLGVALPLVHVFSDEVVAGGSIMVLRRLFCCTCSRRSRVGPQPDRVPCHQRF